MTEVTVFPAAREEGQAVSMAHCTCPAAQDTHRKLEVGERGGGGLMKG